MCRLWSKEKEDLNRQMGGGNELMGVQINFTCDECGITKKESNHWWLMRFSGHSVNIVPWGNDNDLRDAIIVCGQECMMKKLSYWMDKIK